MSSVVDVIAAAWGYRPPIDGLIGSGLEKMIAYQRAREAADALGLPPDLDVETVRAWGSGAVMHLGPSAAEGSTE